MQFTKINNMGFGFIIWSMLSFATPVTVQPQPQQVVVVEQTETIAQEATTVLKKGVASFYHPKFVGRKTATGEVFSNEKFTAASNYFKLGTYVKVTNTANGRSIYVKINDRMGHPTRLIDLTSRAARELKFVNRGTAKVKIEQVSAPEGKREVLAQLAPEDSQPNDVL